MSDAYWREEPPWDVALIVLVYEMGALCVNVGIAFNLFKAAAWFVASVIGTVHR